MLAVSCGSVSADVGEVTKTHVESITLAMMSVLRPKGFDLGFEGLVRVLV